MSQEPQRFGKYQIIERIAAGGMAEVFKARLEGIGGFHRTYAIKRILPHLTSNSEFVDMLINEAKIAGLLSHANIVQILDLGAVDEQYFIAMEYVNGKDLGQILERCAKKGITLPFPHAVYVLIEMLKGLEYAHNRTVVRDGVQVPLDIIHRDISPANVLVSVQGEVKLTDFGIAKATVKAAETQTGVIKGRFDYMAPEQAAGRPLDQRADLFAAGVVFYELLTGRHPFREAGDLKTLEAVRRGVVEPPSHINPDVPPALDLVIAAALRLDPAERYPTATAFKDALNTFFHDSGFIFSAATLATFVRGLLQDGEKPAPKPSEIDTGPYARAAKAAAAKAASATATPAAPEVPTAARSAPASSSPRGSTGISRPVPGPGALGAPSRPPAAPARMATAPPPVAPSATRPPPAASRPAPAAPPAPVHTRLPPMGLAEESTLIRNPTLGPGYLPDPSGPAQWSDAATVIRPDPFGPPTHPDPRVAARQPMDQPADRGQVMRRPALDAPRPDRLSVRADARPDLADSRPRVVYRTPNGVHLAYVTVCFFILMLGLACGFVIGTSKAPGGQGAGMGVMAAPPAIEIRAPAGFTAAVDGKPLTGNPPWTTALVANTPAVVRVSGPGYGPVEAHLQLQPNQMRILDFTPAAPATQPPVAAGPEGK